MNNLATIKEYMTESGISANALAKAVELSSATVSLYLSEKYNGDVSNVESAILAYIEAQKSRIEEVPTVKIDAVSRFNSVAGICRANGKLAVFCGRAGTGKTTASKNYARNNRGTVYILAKVRCTPSKLFAQLSKAVGIEPRRYLNDMYDDVCDKLSGSKRLIIIDEAEHLPYDALELLRALFDETGCGLVLVGLERLIHNLTGKRGEYEQLYSRVAIYQKAVPVALSDAQAYVSATLPKHKELSAVFHKHSGGNMRLLANLVWNSIRIAQINKCAVSKEVIELATEDLVR